MSYLNTLLEQRKGVATAVDAIRKEWKGKEGVMPPEVEEKLDRALDDFDKLTDKIDREEKAARIDAWANETKSDLDVIVNGGEAPRGKDDPRYTAFVKSLFKGSALDKPFTEAERKAMQADDWAGGGVLLAPQQFVSQILKNVGDQLFMRQLSTVYSNVPASGLGVPRVDSDAADAEWTSELAESNETVVTFGKRELKPHTLKRAVKISVKLLKNSALDVEAFVQSRIAYKFALPQEKAYLTGNGTNQPLGIFTAHADGISTSRDVTTAGASAVTGDDFIDLLYALKAQYQARASFVLGRAVVKAIRKLKTSQGEYIWTLDGLQGRSIAMGSPGAILGRPYYMSEHAPATITTGLYTAVCGDFSHYWIVDSEDLRIQVLNELYARTSQVGYHCEGASDGAPVLEEAFARLKQA